MMDFIQRRTALTSHLTDYSEQVRLPLPTDDELSEESKKLLKAANDPNVLRMFAGTEEMFVPTVGFIKAMFGAEGIDPKTRELIVLRCAKKLRCPYEWDLNVRMARNAGCTEDEIKAVESGVAVVGIADEYVLACRATDELTDLATLRDETLSELQHHFGDVRTRKIILLISWFNLLSRWLNGCRVPIETADKIGNKTSPTK
jgi:alkylhydroperoxidase family enzyme